MLTHIRFVTQIGVLCLLIAVTYLNHYENQKIKYGGQVFIEDSLILRGIDALFGELENRKGVLTFVQGDVWSFEVGGIKVTDPLAFLGNLSRTKKIYGVLFIASLMPILCTVFLGKVFCGWICPMGFFMEANDKLRSFLLKRGIPLLQVRVPKWLKHLILGVGLLSGLLFGMHYFFLIYPPKLVSGEIFFWVTRSAFSFGLSILFLIFFMDFFLGRRLWCRSFCPGGALYTLLSRFRILNVHNDFTRCTDCGVCDELCPYDLLPSKGKVSWDCDQCFLCIDNCAPRSLSFLGRVSSVFLSLRKRQGI